LKQIIHSNKYSVTFLNSINNKRQKQKQKQDDQNPKSAKFTYVGRETIFITNLFRLTNLKKAYTTNGTLGRLLEVQNKTKIKQFRQEWSISVDFPNIPKEICGTNRTPKSRKVPRTL